jgi:hypothetical protein
MKPPFLDSESLLMTGGFISRLESKERECWKRCCSRVKDLWLAKDNRFLNPKSSYERFRRHLHVGSSFFLLPRISLSSYRRGIRIQTRRLIIAAGISSIFSPLGTVITSITFHLSDSNRLSILLFGGSVLTIIPSPGVSFRYSIRMKKMMNPSSG